MRNKLFINKDKDGESTYTRSQLSSETKEKDQASQVNSAHGAARPLLHGSSCWEINVPPTAWHRATTHSTAQHSMAPTFL